MISWTLLKFRTPVLLREWRDKHLLGEWKNKSQTVRKYLQNISDKGLVSEIYKELLKFNIKKTNNSVKNGQKIWTDISPMKICRWQISIRKYAQYLMPLGNCKLNQQRDTNHYTAIRMAKIHNIHNTKCWQGCSTTLLVRMQSSTATLEDSLAVSYKYNCDPGIVLLDIYPTELKT